MTHPLRIAFAASLLALAACKSSPKTIDTGSCGYTLTLSSTTFTAVGAPASATVTPSAGNSSACAWTLTSDASWIVVATGSTGTGQGTAAFAVSSNFATVSRAGNMLLSWSGPTTGTKSVGVTQNGV